MRAGRPSRSVAMCGPQDRRFIRLAFGPRSPQLLQRAVGRTALLRSPTVRASPALREPGSAAAPGSLSRRSCSLSSSWRHRGSVGGSDPRRNWLGRRLFSPRSNDPASPLTRSGGHCELAVGPASRTFDSERRRTMKLMLTLLACLVALATTAPALAGNGQSVTESVGAVQVSSTSVNPPASVAAPMSASAPVCVASSCSTGQSEGQAGSSASTTGGGQSRPAGQKVSQSVGAVQVGSTTASPAVSVTAPAGAFVPVCVASGCSASQSVGQPGAGSGSTSSDGQSQTIGQQPSQTPNTVKNPTTATPSRKGSTGSGGAQRSAGNRSAGHGTRNGVFARSAAGSTVSRPLQEAGEGRGITPVTRTAVPSPVPRPSSTAGLPPRGLSLRAGGR